MEYENIKVDMRVKINLDKKEEYYNEEYDGREGRVFFVGNKDDDEYCVDVNVEKLDGKVEVGILFKCSELEEVD